MIGKDLIRAFLPHREPFLFLDRVERILLPGGEEWAPPTTVPPEDMVGAEVVAGWRVDPGLPMFRGHFPGDPVLPGVIQVEAMSQAAGMCRYPCFHGALRGKKIRTVLAAVEGAKFRTLVSPPADLEIRVTITRARGGLYSDSCRILDAGGKPVSEARILSKIEAVPAGDAA